MEEYRNYYLRLAYADWFYEYSDDHRVYTKGRDEVYALMREADKDDVKQRMYDEFSKWKNLRRESKPTLKEFGYEDE